MENNTTEVTRPPECGAFEDVSAFRFWFDGVLVSVIAVVGFAGNLLALVVLSRDGVCLGVSLVNFLGGNLRYSRARGGSEVA